MSMTLINFVKKNKLQTKIALENKIKELGYDFKFLTDFKKLENLNQIDSIYCELNGNATFIEIYLYPKKEIIFNFPDLKKQFSDKNFGISFTLDSNELVSACINLISIGLIDLSESIVFYVDDEIIYSREMLIQDTSKSLDYIENEIYSIPEEALEENLKFDQNNKKEKRIKNLINFILWGFTFLAIILMNRKIITWYIPSVLLTLIIIKSVIDHHNKK